ncbi:hypothetical protein [Delftia acidovorans]|uniref:hypothetical protein n=1 Tax=Delftia acidovorans TaxID=80866 RepID=UPI003D10D428
MAPDINAPVLQSLSVGSLLRVLPQAPQAQFSAVRIACLWRELHIVSADSRRKTDSGANRTEFCFIESPDF